MLWVKNQYHLPWVIKLNIWLIKYYHKTLVIFQLQTSGLSPSDLGISSWKGKRTIIGVYYVKCTLLLSILKGAFPLFLLRGFWNSTHEPHTHTKKLRVETDVTKKGSEKCLSTKILNSEIWESSLRFKFQLNTQKDSWGEKKVAF